MTAVIDLTGQAFGHLTVVERDGSDRLGRARWLCQCACGANTTVRSLDIRYGHVVSCGCHRRRLTELMGRANRRESVTYHGAHKRVRLAHGKATEHACVDCGGAAADWSYNHTDPNADIDVRGRVFSMQPEHYSPRCRSCHHKFDRNDQPVGSGLVVQTERT